jgi:hypothetical protein
MVLEFYLDILAVPEYPSDAVSHWGLIIFTELALLYNPLTTSELEYQRIALLVAKELAEQVRILTFFVFLCEKILSLSSGVEISFHFNGGLIYGYKKRLLII